MSYEIPDIYDLYDSPEECARVAALRFNAKGWKWKRNTRQTYGYIPSETEIHARLLGLQRGAVNNNCESGRLVFYHGRFGVQRPTQPHPLIQG